ETDPSGSTVVTVAHGAVAVENPYGRAVVPAGSFTVARAEIPPLPPEEIDTDAALDWCASPAKAEPPLVDEEVAVQMDVMRRQMVAKRAELQALRERLRKIDAAGTR